MTTPDPTQGIHSRPPRAGIPVWAWGLAGCACLPVLGMVLLAAILLPVLKGLRQARREEMRTETCLSNVRQAGTSVQMYVQDYDDTYPVSSTWMEGIAPYTNSSGGKLRSILQCPAVHIDHPDGYGYAFNSKLSAKKASKVSAPALTPMVYDSSNLAKDASDPVTSLPHPARHLLRGPRRRAGKHVNIMGYADGHAKALSEDGKTAAAPGIDGSGD